MIGRRKLSRELDDERLVLARRESDVCDRRLPCAGGIAHLERRRRHGDGRLLRDRHIDACVRGVDPAAKKEYGIAGSGRLAQVENQLVRPHHALVRGGRQIRNVHVVVVAQRWKDVGAALVDRRQRRHATRHLKEAKLHRPRRHETFVDEYIDRIRMVDGEQLHLVRVGRLPELLGELKDVAAVARLQRVAWNAQVLL